MGKYANVLKMYRFDLTEGKINEQLVEIRNKITPNKEKLKTLFSCLDLTSLNITDTTKHISELTEKINNFTHHFADIPQIAAFCFYPTFLETVKKELTAQHVAIATVVGFPNPLTFIEVRIAESALAASEGADEIDTVIPIQKILENNYDDAGEELEEIKHACRHAKLKVILETGALNNL
ncbi:MAG: deoxyribose-phosphate aldolase, partial [Bacteroidales bacterium]|nr:deoxyribose-phosphate aldolase [Bacteroidales bacterium]